MTNTIRNDQAWRDAAERLASAKVAKDAAETEYKAALDAATLLAPNGAKGFGVTMTEVYRQGAIAYKQAIEGLFPSLSKDLLEPYRGKDSLSYRVSVDVGVQS